MADQNFAIMSGDVEPITFTVRTSAGVPVDVSTASAVAWKLALTPYSAALVSKSLGSGISISTSTVSVTLAAADTETLHGIYYHEMQITDGSGHKKTQSGWIAIGGDLIT